MLEADFPISFTIGCSRQVEGCQMPAPQAQACQITQLNGQAFEKPRGGKPRDEAQGVIDADVLWDLILEQPLMISGFRFSRLAALSCKLPSCSQYSLKNWLPDGSSIKFLSSNDDKVRVSLIHNLAIQQVFVKTFFAESINLLKTKRIRIMTRITQNPITRSSNAHANRTAYSLEESEKLDREENRDYLPMDVYIDPQTIKNHFQKPTRLLHSYSSPC